MPLSPPVARIALLTTLTTLPAHAQQAAAAAQPVSFFGEILSIVVPLAFIILVLFAALHFARRRYGAAAPDAALSVVQILPLGPRERIVLLRTRGGRLFAVGVTANSVRLVTDLDPADLAPGDPATGATVVADAPDPSGPSKVFGRPLIPRDLLRGRRGTAGPGS